ncbi:TRAP-type C4-dicarboxylate transport system substrate-binding protein [Homoserinimonas aerilata]|uniref:TRAP-type C4-dicarboxylate transport system substrate-binding protein n=1 Tax=Homoserinimonas aerilata TaxID=1162970 RepID=A0A542YFB4_9MICO|nr:TRAP transporter substrate-binding protein DctP [Homoserinimonas aerilata]TQL46762.1 TRAP-type C4-dicarboxylate transport system substrate-binding protein [Homoserinimonas aerilata]
MTIKNKRRAQLAAIGTLAAAALVLAGCSATTGADGEETFDLTWTSYTTPEGYYSMAMDEWISIVEEKTEGRVTIEPFYMGSLCSTMDGLACAKDGRADIAYTSPAFHPAEFPLANVVTVPFVAKDPVAQTAAAASLYESNADYAAEFEAEGIHALYFAPVTTSILGTKTAVDSYAELKGLSVRSTARMLKASEIAGSNPSAIPVSEIYESIENGVIDAWSATGLESAITEWNLGEVTPYMTDTQSGSFINVMAIINAEVWNTMPADIQKIMTEASDTVWGGLSGEYLDAIFDETCDRAADQGVTLSTWSDAESKKWADAVGDTLLNDWKSEVKAGSDADVDAFYADYLQQLEDASATSTYVAPVEYCLARG